LLDPLIAEAKRRARQRRFLVALSALLLVVLATGLTLGFRLSGGGPSGGFAATGASIRMGALAVALPRNFHRYNIRGGIYRTGTRPPVIGVVVTDYRLKAGPRSAFVNWSHLKSPPASRVALELTLWVGIGVDPPARLHLPLSLDQRWFEEHPRHGSQRGYRVGFLSFHGQLYEIFFWSGRVAPPHDRAAVLNALTSIQPAR
jgi:hypothetical protein